MRTVAVVAGAGRGERLGREGGKQFAPLAGVPVLARSLWNLQACEEVDGIVVAVNPGEVERAEKEIVSPYGLTKVIAVVEGGEHRQESVYRALKAIPGGTELVLVHDGARPFAGPSLFRRVINAMRDTDGAIAAVPVVDTVKEVEGGWVIRTLERRRLWAVQTPQCFQSFALLDSHERAKREGVWATDDASLLERYRYRVRVVRGEVTNIKITYPSDLVAAEALLAAGLITDPLPPVPPGGR
jgi:2-C-methyl-D-erythritol 4-phosphate cytidylyltransferase